MEILKVEHLSKYYGKNDTLVKALDDVNFSVNKGEFVAIIGKSGSGKSTLLHILGGVDNPSNGNIYVNGINVFSKKENDLAKYRRKEVGLIYQFYNLIPILNIKENIELPLLLDGVKANEIELNELIDMLNLKDRINHLPGELSGGQQQRVAIGRALICHPSIVLADEPTGNLDSKNSEEIMNLLRESNKKYNQTIIMITHNNELANLADRIVTIEDGNIISDINKN